MNQPIRRPVGGVQLLPAGIGSLARGLPPVPSGTLFVLGERGGISVAPTAKFTVIFGRNEPAVHVCVGAIDPEVSRQHGLLRHDGRRWLVQNTGTLPIRLPGSQLLLSSHEEPLPVAYTPLFIRSRIGREHLLEVRVAGAEPTGCPGHVRFDATTRCVGTTWLGQRYLRHEAYPQPLSCRDVQAELKELQPEAGWTARKAEHTVHDVRLRLTKGGVSGITRDEVGEPVGNALNHNLIVELLLSTTLVPPDLRLLD